MDRYGVVFRASPRQADVIIVAGTLTNKVLIYKFTLKFQLFANKATKFDVFLPLEFDVIYNFLAFLEILNFTILDLQLHKMNLMKLQIKLFGVACVRFMPSSSTKL